MSSAPSMFDMHSEHLKQFENGLETPFDGMWESEQALPSGNGFDAGSQGATAGAAPVNEPENNPAGPVGQPGPLLPDIESLEELQASLSPEGVEEIERQVLSNDNAGQQAPVAPHTGSRAFASQENPLALPAGLTAQQQAPGQVMGPVNGPFNFQAPLRLAPSFPAGARYYPGAQMPPLQQSGIAAPPLAATNPGLAPLVDQEMYIAPPANPLKRKYGDPMYPSELPEVNGRYRVKKPVGKQKNPHKRVRVDQEGERHDSAEIVDNQEPTAKPLPKNPSRVGPTMGWPQQLRLHHNRCRDPDAGCDKCCTIHLFPAKYEKLRTAPTKKLPHLAPEHRVKKWEHLAQ